MKEKREGELKKRDEKKVSANVGGTFHDKTKDPIAGLEEQLLKAETTLLELQEMKKKLLLDKKKEQEVQNVQKLTEENTKLRFEIKSYQTDINSLKSMIISLKEDIQKSTEQFQTKVENSLNKLVEADASLDKVNKAVAAVSKNYFGRDNVSQPEENIPTEKTEPESINDNIQPVAPVENRLEPVAADTPAAPPPEIKQELPPAPVDSASPAPALSPSPAPTAPILPAAAAETEIKTANDPSPTTNQAPLNPTVPTEQSATVEENNEEELAEYNKIKAELDAIENEDVLPDVTDPARLVGEASDSPTQPENSAQIANEEAKQAFWPENNNKESNSNQEKPRKKLLFIVKRNKKIKKDKKDKPDKSDINAEPSGGKAAIKAAGVLMILFAGGVAYQMANAENLRTMYESQVKSNQPSSIISDTTVPDGFSKDSEDVRHKEAFTDIPFDGTVWETYNDQSFGIKLDYPKNTSYKLKSTESNNLWFLRKDGYLMKISRTDSDMSLEEYLTNQKTTISYKSETATFDGLAAIHLIQSEYLPTRGNKYIVKNGSAIYEIWHKTFAAGENADDENRVTKMLDSFTFTSTNKSRK